MENANTLSQQTSPCHFSEVLRPVQLALIGPVDQGEFAYALSNLPTNVCSRVWPSIDAFLMDSAPQLSAHRASDFQPDIILLLEAHPGGFLTDEWLQLNQQFPIESKLLLHTSWGEGQRRTGFPLTGVQMISWIEFPYWFAQQLRRQERGLASELSLPASASLATQVLCNQKFWNDCPDDWRYDWLPNRLPDRLSCPLPDLGTAKNQSQTNTPSVHVISDDRFVRRTLDRIWTSRQAEVRDFRIDQWCEYVHHNTEPPFPDLVLLHPEYLTSKIIDAMDMFRKSNRSSNGDTRLIVFFDSPRLDEVEQLIDSGADQIRRVIDVM